MDFSDARSLVARDVSEMFRSRCRIKVCGRIRPWTESHVQTPHCP